jgi:ubiquitin related modifier 1
MLFSNERKHTLIIPATDENNKPVTISYLIDYLCDNTMNDSRKELFVLDDHL